MFKNCIVNLKTNFLPIAATLLLINPLVAKALGLGNARIISNLNEPLNIEVELLANNPKELQGVLPNLASPQDFEQAGLVRADFLNTVEFKVELQADKPIIRLTTKEPVKEPVVNLLVELNSAQGRMLKDFTVLLDPPELNKHTKSSNPSIKPVQQQSSQRAENKDNEIFDAFNQRVPSVSVSTRTQELNQTLQARLGKIEKQLGELEAEKTLSEQAKHALEEENNNLHDLVEAKQKEITQLKEQHVANNQPAEALPSEAPKAVQQRSELSHFAKTQILAPTEENLQNTMPSSSAPWLLLGLILTIMLSAIIGLREFLKRKDISLPFEVNLPAFAFDSKENITPTKRTDTPPSAFNNQQVNQQAFQNAVSLIKAAEQKQSPQQMPTQSASAPVVAPISKQPAEPANLPTIEDAEIYITFSKFKMAEEILVKILDYDPDNIKARLKLIDLFFAQDKITEVKEQFNFLPANFSTNYVNEYRTYQERLNALKSEQIKSVTEPTQQKNESINESEPAVKSPQTFVPQESQAAPAPKNPQPIELDPTIFQTKLDFAKVYIDMNDIESARDLLNEVIQSDFENLKAEALELLEKTKK